MADFGYDVSDHCDVDPRFGTLADFDALAREARRLGLRLILDYIPNHTSIEHPWFREHPERYLWRAGEPDAPPTNWVSNFGGSAWAWDADRGAWYYHAYLPEQPDLDWRNPDVREAMLAVLRFWVEHGADGFRIDALRQTIKDDRWRDNPPNPAWREGDDPYRALIPAYTTDRDEVLELVALMRAAVGPDRALIGELYLPLERLVRYYGAGLDLPSNFHLISTPWEAEALGAHIAAFESLLPGRRVAQLRARQPRPAADRLARRAGARRAWPPCCCSRCAAPRRSTTATSSACATSPIPPDRVQDPWERRVPGLGRDPVRTPMRWSAAGGFSDGEPWLPAGDEPSVEEQERDPGSMLSLYRRLLALAPRRGRALDRRLGVPACRRRRARLPPRRPLPRRAQPHRRRARAARSTAAPARTSWRGGGAGRRGAAARPRRRRASSASREAAAEPYCAPCASPSCPRSPRRCSSPPPRRRRTLGSASASSTSPTRAARTSSRRTRCTRSSARSRPARTCSSSTSA